MSVLIWLITVLIPTVVALFFRFQSQERGQRIQRESERAEMYRQLAENRRRLAEESIALERQHQQETLDETAHLADRDQFDNAWGPGLHDDEDRAGSSAAVAATPSDAAGD